MYNDLMTTDYETYQSPFTWRYGNEAMRRIWSEAGKRRLWRRMWLALAEVQAEYGLVRPEQIQDLRVHCDSVDVGRALQIEAEIHHDLMAELQTYAEQAKLGGAILHLGATSADIYLDSELLVRQLTGAYRVKHPALKPLHEEVKRLLSGLSAVTINHVPRRENAEADNLANTALG